jgi:hypothetical protein
VMRILHFAFSVTFTGAQTVCKAEKNSKNV